MNFSWWTNKKLSFTRFAGKKNNKFLSFDWMNDQWTFPGKKNGNFGWWLKISKKKPLVFYRRFLFCYGNESDIVTGSFVLSRAKFQKLSRPLFVFHGHFFCYFVTGYSSIFTGKIWGFLSRALFQNHGHFFKKCHGQTENCHGKKKTTLRGAFSTHTEKLDVGRQKLRKDVGRQKIWKIFS